MASRLLKRQAPSHAARFNLKKAIMELGPSGYPFERFVAALFEEEGFSTQAGKVLQGQCVTHEIDVIGTKGTELMLVECKYHNTSGIHVDVKVPLYIHSRFQDLLDNNLMGKTYTGFTGWIATNSKFSDDAIAFARCKGMQLLGWGFPEGNSLKDRIDRTGLYPVTCLSTLTQAEKSFLMEKHIVLARELYANPDWLRKAGVQEPRFRETILELEHLLNQAQPST
jgi:hypothetical protein